MLESLSEMENHWKIWDSSDSDLAAVLKLDPRNMKDKINLFKRDLGEFILKELEVTLIKGIVFHIISLTCAT